MLGSLVLARQSLCDWTERDARLSELVAGLQAGRRVAMPFDLLAIGASPALQRACAEGFVADKCPPSNPPLWQGERYAHDRIRIAYLSADFCDHPVSYLVAGMLEKHDRTRLQTYGISLAPRAPSPMSARIERAFENFIHGSERHDSDLAALLRAHEIDIAVDLMGHTRDSRTAIFAARPCPIQVSFVGFAGTMGAAYIDYLIADRIVVPEPDKAHFAEKIVYLPHNFLPNDDTRAIAATTPSRATEGLPERGFVFCSFNQSYKITREIFDCWMRLLHDLEGSVLWLSRSEPDTQAHLTREANARGIASERLVFARWTERQEDHLARHRLADLFLDTPVFNAHSTAADALWSGLPVLTCLGSTFAGRVAGSLLNAVGLPELITQSLAEYESLALRLARDPELHAAIKGKLARNRQTHPLFDTVRFTRHLEAAYTAMRERQQRGEPAASFAVDPIA